MLDAIPLQFLSDASAWIVTAATFLTVARLIYTGSLVPRSTYRDRQAEQEKFVESLRLALEEERDTNRRLMELVRELQAPSAKAVEVLETVQKVSKNGGSG